MLTRTHYWYQHEPCWYVRKKNALVREGTGAIARRVETGTGSLNPVQRQLQSRLKMLERRLSMAAEPTKAVLPAWLVGQLQSQGIPFTSHGRPDLTFAAGVTRV